MGEAALTIPDSDALSCRVHPLHLRQRLGIEADREALMFGQGRNFFHIENAYGARFLIRWSLRLCALHGRGRRNALAIEARSNRVALAQLPAPFRGYKILHLSDLHVDMSPGMVPALTQRLRDLDYDLVVLTGDYRAETHGPIGPALDGLEQLRPYLRAPAYAVLGNHDSIRMVPRLEAMGIQMLLNEWVPIERGGHRIFLAGIDDPHYYRADNLERSCEGMPDGAPSILLSHSPEIYRQAAHLGFDLMLCGHTHGGQICLPTGIPLLTNARSPRAFARGAWAYHQLVGYTSPGSGTALVDVRLNCPPEITIHSLVPA